MSDSFFNKIKISIILIVVIFTFWELLFIHCTVFLTLNQKLKVIEKFY